MPDAPRSPLPTGTFRLGSVAGCDVLVSSSWFLVAALISVVVAPRVEQVQPGLGIGTYAVGLVFAVVLYGAVLLHEISHAVMAKHYGFPVRSITLHFLGGMTAVGAEARTPRQEFWVAVVGPLTSIAVGVVALVALLAAPADLGLLQLILEGLAGANLLIGVLNLVPGLPLDGGRVLKAAVWKLSGRAHIGIRAAAWGGRVAAVAALTWPFLASSVGVRATVVDYVIAVVIAVFLWTGAGAAMRSALLAERMPGLVARDLARRTLAVPEDLPLAEAVRRAQEERAGAIVTVTGAGRPVGVVNESALDATPAERRPWVATSTVARTLERGLELPVAITGPALVDAIRAVPAAEYLLVEDDGRVAGVLSAADVDRAIRGTRR